MGRIDLQICAKLEGLASLHISPETDWHFKVKCTSCGEEHENMIYFNLVEKQAMEKSRGEAHFIQKCKNCERTSSIEYVGKHAAYTDQNENFKTIAQFECRGMEFTEFFPEKSVTAKSSFNDTVFGDDEPIDMTTERDWAGYDEDAEEAVGIYDFKA